MHVKDALGTEQNVRF